MLSPDIETIEVIDKSLTPALIEQNVIEPHAFTECGNDGVIENNTLADLEMVDSYRPDPTLDDTVLDSLDYTYTHGGKMVLKNLLTNPVHDTVLLVKRKRIIEAIESVYEQNRGDTERLLNVVQENVDTVSWFMRSRSEEEDALFNMVYFSKRYTKFLNKKPACLTTVNLYRILACPAIGIITPILYFVVPYLVILWKFKWNIGFVEYLKVMYEAASSQWSSNGTTKLSMLSAAFSLVFYFQSVFTTFEVSSTMKKIVDIITDRCVSVTKFVEASESLRKLYGGHFLNTDFGFEEIGPSGKDGAIIESLSMNVHDKFSVFKACSLGSVLVKFKEFDWRSIVPLMVKVSIVDAIVSVINASESLALCSVEYLKDDDTPKLEARGLWHPCLPSHAAVRNDIAVGGDRPNNMILTGPNAGGKSTFVKGVFVNIVLAQSICLAAAESFELTPFHIVSTQMNVPDCKGKESLFEAEMNRCKQKIDTVHASHGKFIAFAFDEIFSSTEPIEGMSGAYAIARSLGQHTNVVTFITTHYKHLCKLAEEEDFEAMKMSAKVDERGEISFSYVLEKGISDQHIALELLRDRGFDASIIDDAIAQRTMLLADKDVVR